MGRGSYSQPSASRHRRFATFPPGSGIHARVTRPGSRHTAASLKRPTAASSVPSPDSRARPACRARHPHGSDHLSAPPTRRACARTRPASQAATVALGHQPKALAAAPITRPFVIAPRQLRRTTQTAGQVICLQNLHHFLRSVQRGLHASALKQSPTAWTTDNSGQNRCGEKMAGPRGEILAVSGDF